MALIGLNEGHGGREQVKFLKIQGFHCGWEQGRHLDLHPHVLYRKLKDAYSPWVVTFLEKKKCRN